AAGRPGPPPEWIPTCFIARPPPRDPSYRTSGQRPSSVRRAISRHSPAPPARSPCWIRLVLRTTSPSGSVWTCRRPSHRPPPSPSRWNLRESLSDSSTYDKETCHEEATRQKRPDSRLGLLISSAKPRDLQRRDAVRGRDYGIRQSGGHLQPPDDAELA